MHNATLTLINKSTHPSITLTLPLSEKSLTLVDGKHYHDLDFKYYVVESDNYEVKLELADDELEIHSICLTINDIEISQFINKGFGSNTGSSYYWTGNGRYPELKEKPFFLFYDHVKIGINFFVGSQMRTLVSPKLVCKSSNLTDNEQIQAIIKELTNDANNDAIGLMFANEQSSSNHSSLSIKNFNKLIDNVLNCYQTNLVHFTSQAKYNFAPSLELTAPNRIRTLSPISLRYLAQDPTYSQQQNTFSKRIPTFQKIKSFKNNENLQVCNFLSQVLANTIKTKNDLENLLSAKTDKSLLNSDKLKLPLEAFSHQTMVNDLNVLKEKIVKLKQIKRHYEQLFGFHASDRDVGDSSLKRLPPLNNVYQQVAPYHQAYACMKDYFDHDVCNLNKERLLLKAKTLDALFEYYCLYCFINMLIKNGFTQDKSNLPITYNYRNHYEKDEVTAVANTYYFTKSSYKVTLYYQPIVSSSYIENSNMLFRTTDNSSLYKSDDDFNFYNPDFVLKISSPSTDEYLIFDAKYSTGYNIINFHLEKLIKKYCLNTACLYLKHSDSISQQQLNKEELSLSDLQDMELATKAPKMMYALQGKVNIQGLANFWHYHDSPISRIIAPPPTKIGVLELNALSDNNEKILWDEICSVLPQLK